LRDPRQKACCVTEVGDFIAHPDKRDRGVMTDDVRAWYSTVAFQVQRLFPGGYTETRLPADFYDLIRANFRRLGLKEIRQRTGINEVQAVRSFKRVKEKFVANADGTLSLAPSVSAQEKKLIYCLKNVMIVRPALSSTPKPIKKHSSACRRVGRNHRGFSPVRTTRPDTGEDVNMAQAIFSTGLLAADHCEPELLDRPGRWELTLEVTVNGKLGFIR
jgi:hypothetical protein